MITVKVDSAGLIRSLEKLAGNFQRTSTVAVVKTSTELVNGIVMKLLGPPPGPLPKYYVRTWRLIHGWGPAARLLGITLPALTQFAGTSDDEGTASLYEDQNGTTFRAANEVPYAYEVENAGTWKSPFPKLRGGYFTTRDSVNEVRQEEKFPKYVREAWTLAKNAS